MRPNSHAAVPRRSRFLPEEDALLKHLVMKCGLKSWRRVAAELPGRNPRQCRDRWHHYLSECMHQEMTSSESCCDHIGWADQKQGNRSAKMPIQTRDSVLSVQNDCGSNDSSRAALSAYGTNPWPVPCVHSASPVTSHQSYETDGQFSFELCWREIDLTDVIEWYD
jgi:hypothetical protein